MIQIMKTSIHPKWFPEAKVTCACGKVFTTGSTVPEFRVEVCSLCHPFYTGQMKFVDTAGRVDAFMAKQKRAVGKYISKTEKRKIQKEKRVKEELERPDTLEEIRKLTKNK